MGQHVQESPRFGTLGVAQGLRRLIQFQAQQDHGLVDLLPGVEQAHAGGLCDLPATHGLDSLNSLPVSLVRLARAMPAFPQVAQAIVGLADDSRAVDFARQGQRSVITSLGFIEPVLGAEEQPQVEQHVGCLPPVLVTLVEGDGQSLLVVGLRFGPAAEQEEDLAQIVVDAALALAVFQLAPDSQRLSIVVQGGVPLTQLFGGVAQLVERPALLPQVAGLLEQAIAILEQRQGGLEFRQLVVDDAHVLQSFALTEHIAQAGVDLAALTICLDGPVEQAAIVVVDTQGGESSGSQPMFEVRFVEQPGEGGFGRRVVVPLVAQAALVVGQQVAVCWPAETQTGGHFQNLGQIGQLVGAH